MACRRERANHALGGIWPQFARTFSSLLVISGVGLLVHAERQAEKQAPAAVKPLWQRGLTGDDAKNVAAIEDQIASLAKEGKFAEAAERRRSGGRHSNPKSGRGSLAVSRRAPRGG